MSVYTQLTDDQFAAFCQSFGVSFARAIPITQGVKNSNWFIQTTDDADGSYSYVFTLFEERPPSDIEKMAVILNQLAGKLPVAAPLPVLSSKSEDVQRYVMRYENKAITVVPCLAGTHPTRNSAAMCRDMGAALAVLHKTLQDLTPAEDYGVPLYPWADVRDREMQYMPSDEAMLMSDIWQAYSDLPLDTLPQGLCHLDMFADNTLWDLQTGDERLTGLLDFTEVSVEHYVMDIAITINDFCTTWGNATEGESVDFDRHKMRAFLEGYESERPLSAAERRTLPIFLAKAAVIFWLLRLNVIHYNRTEGRTGDNIMVKNPDLMKRLAAYHWANVEKAHNSVFILLAKTDADAAGNIIGVFSNKAQAEEAQAKLGSHSVIEEHTLNQAIA
ncbi:MULTISPECIES: homoserine kinase [unclassified Psychrobacter]|uniref:homoserine kinase n=1 Tax=unclassified Psychrobacter TaxID=196806 RepID=UPI0018F2A8CA|nr:MULTISPECIES: homoserine kinase [unclassified Psychrobacter]